MGHRFKKKEAYECCKVVNLTDRQPASPRKYSWYSFLLGAEPTPGPQCGWKDYVNKKFQLPNGESNPLPKSQPTAPLRAPTIIFDVINNSHTVLQINNIKMREIEISAILINA
jgi:hypothetical protein